MEHSFSNFYIKISRNNRAKIKQYKLKNNILEKIMKNLEII